MRKKPNTCIVGKNIETLLSTARRLGRSRAPQGEAGCGGRIQKRCTTLQVRPRGKSETALEYPFKLIHFAEHLVRGRGVRPIHRTIFGPCAETPQRSFALGVSCAEKGAIHAKPVEMTSPPLGHLPILPLVLPLSTFRLSSPLSHRPTFAKDQSKLAYSVPQCSSTPSRKDTTCFCKEAIIAHCARP